MSGVLRLSNNVTGRSTIVASANTDQTFTLPSIGGTLLTGGSSLEVIFPPGTEALPGLHVQGDVDTGLYAPAANSLGISTAGSQRLIIDASGRVGIGNSTMYQYLEVGFTDDNATFQGTGAFGDWGAGSRGILLENKSSTTGSKVLAQFRNTANDWFAGTAHNGTNTDFILQRENFDPTLIVSAEGRLLMGTPSDITGSTNYILQAATTGGGSIALARNDGTVGVNESMGRITFYGNDGGTYEAVGQIDCQADDPHAAGDKPGRLVFSTTADGASAVTERMRLDSSGSLLIGSTQNQIVGRGSIGGRLQVSADDNEAAITIKRATAGAFGSYLGLGKARGTLASPSIVLDGDELGTISFGAYDGTDYASFAAQITAIVDGLTGENNTPGKLHIYTTPAGGSQSLARMQIDARGQFIAISDGTGSVDNMLSTLGASSSSTKLLSCRRNATSENFGSGTEVCVIRRNGDLDNTNNSYGALSDIKLKENIVDAGSQWEDLKAIRFRKYNYKKETRNDTLTQLGVIAQELELVSPGLVTTTPDLDENDVDLGTTTKSVKYSVLTLKALVALQEAMTRIEALETEVSSLRAK